MATVSPTDRLALHRWMLLSRAVEGACGSLSPKWFPTEGEDAVLVGAFFGLRQDDWIAPHYRGPFASYLLRGASLARLIAGMLGRPGGYSRGRGMPFMGPSELNIVPWVGGDLGTSLGVATGVALAATYQQSDHVVVCSFGDGTASRGDFHEAVNMAGVLRLPIVFVCQNNGWAISVPHARQTAASGIAIRAPGYGIPGVEVDGNDVVSVYTAVQSAVQAARAGEGPTLIDARTYRMRGHWQSDQSEYRTAAEVEPWLSRDPLKLSAASLLGDGLATDAELTAIETEVEAIVARAVVEAQAMPELGEEGIGLDGVFA